jgi:hypothetical protein
MTTPKGKLHATTLAAWFRVLNSLGTRNLRRNRKNRQKSVEAAASL